MSAGGDKNLQHAILSNIKEISQKVGNTDLRREQYMQHEDRKFSRERIEKVFGSWSQAKQAAGLEHKKIYKDCSANKENIFKRNIISVIKEYWDNQPKIQNTYDCLYNFKKSAWISDLHLPFVNQVVLDSFYAFVESTQPDIIGMLGDMYDMYASAKFPRSMNLYTPEQEIELAFHMAENFWAKLRKLCPNARLIGLKGNHCVRPIKRILEVFPEGEAFIELDRYFTFPGVDFILDAKQELYLDNLVGVHGYLSKLGMHRDFFNKNVVCGHSHVGGVSFKLGHDGPLFELNVGYAGDPFSKALSYRNTKYTSWTNGFGYIDTFGPRFIPVYTKIC